MSDEIQIISRDYWFKIVELLQQNWALIDEIDGVSKVYFIGDTSGVFDEMVFPTLDEAVIALNRNGFARFTDDKAAQEMIAAPDAPFSRRPHPNGQIYSSGRYWR